jgi:hypothetical protein
LAFLTLNFAENLSIDLLQASLHSLEQAIEFHHLSQTLKYYNLKHLMSLTSSSFQSVSLKGSCASFGKI